MSYQKLLNDSEPLYDNDLLNLPFYGVIGDGRPSTHIPDTVTPGTLAHSVQKYIILCKSAY